MSKLILVESSIKTGVYTKGPNKGQNFTIGLGRWTDSTGAQPISRISTVPAALEYVKQEQAKGNYQDGKLEEVAVEPYSFKGRDGNMVTTNRKRIVHFDCESLEAAIRAHGKKSATVGATTPRGNEAQASTTPAPKASDVAVS